MGKAKRVAWVLIGLPHSRNDVLLEHLLLDEVTEFEVICTKQIKEWLVKTSPVSDKVVKWAEIENVIAEKLEAVYISGKHVLVKHTNCKRSERKLMCRLLLHHGFDNIRGIYIKNSIEDVLADESVLKDEYTEKDLRAMAAALEKSPPSEEEGFNYLGTW
jgi:predicted kinase